MIFTQLEYVLFFAACFGLHWAAPKRARIYVLFLASLVFYGSWNIRYLGLLLGSTALSYVAARRCDALDDERKRTAWLLAAIVGNLLVLGVFKYYGFFADNVAAFLGVFGMRADFPTLNIILPVGISFYTFQAVSYAVDVWTGRNEAEPSFIHFATYIAFFPQLVAGPIVRADELLPQLKEGPGLTADKVKRGGKLFLWGAIKKCIFADLVALKCVDVIFANPGGYDTATLWLGAFAFSLQVYADFSGYTDMARGSALLLGYELPHNFKLPYLSKSFPEFWNRWHMTLGLWLRDYVFYPMEIRGARKHLAKRAKLPKDERGPRQLPLYKKTWSIMVVFTLCGLWHGAAWQFVLFGIIHGIAVAAHLVWTTKLKGPEWAARRAHPVYSASMAAITFIVLTITFVLFRAETMAEAGTYYAGLFVPTGGERLLHIVPVVLIPVFTAGTIVAANVDLPKLYARVPWMLRSVGYAVAILALLVLAPVDNLAFVYFQF